MGSTFHYLAAPGTDTSVLDWFAALAEPPLVRQDRALLWFGPLSAEALDSDPAEQPVVTSFPPRAHRDDVWTVGEVHFLAPRGRHPGLDRVRARFARWLDAHELAFQQPSAGGRYEEWNRHLRGSVRNVARTVRALPSGAEALRSGVHFVAQRDNEETVAAVLREIDRLR